MAISLDTNVLNVLRKNPGISDKLLAYVTEANIPGFKGHIEVTTKVHAFATGNKQARVFYISPYGEIQDFFVSLKRLLVGVQFNPNININGNITQYVLGQLDANSAEYQLAQSSTNAALNQGMRIVVAVATDGSTINITIDQNQSGRCQIL